MKLTNDKPLTGGHWYHADGTAQHTVLSKKDGLPRATRLSDARKLNLYPSVSGILAILAKPGLDKWRVSQAIMAALTLPRYPDESDDAFVERVAEDANQKMYDAMDFGTALHNSIQQVNMDHRADYTPELAPWVDKYVDWKIANIVRVIDAERTVVHTEAGYAGTFDLLAEHQEHGTVLVDFKSQGIKEGKKHNVYDTWVYQLAAYRAVLGIKCHCLSVIIDSNKPAAPIEHLWSEDEISDGLSIFNRCLEIWQISKGYKPRTP